MVECTCPLSVSDTFYCVAVQLGQSASSAVVDVVCCCCTCPHYLLAWPHTAARRPMCIALPDSAHSTRPHSALPCNRYADCSAFHTHVCTSLHDHLLPPSSTPHFTTTRDVHLNCMCRYSTTLWLATPHVQQPLHSLSTHHIQYDYRHSHSARVEQYDTAPLCSCLLLHTRRH